MRPTWILISEGQEPLAAAAIHDGHDLRQEVADLMILPEADRLREEDPYTGVLTALVGTRITSSKSRFEVDLNRPRDKAVYQSPEDAWGLELWEGAPPADLVTESLARHDAFYSEVKTLFTEMERRYGSFVVLDIHSYNHRRAGSTQPPADSEGNPEVNVGTGTLDRKRWGPLVDRFIADLSQFDLLGRHLDVRENVKFKGGYFSRWTHETFPESACCLAIEFKKFFMDEWTGEIDGEKFEAMSRALQSTLPGLHESLEKVVTA